MNEIRKIEIPTIFDNIDEFIIDDSHKEHRRGSTFYVKSIIQLNEEDAKFFPDIIDFANFIGTWETNQYIMSEEYIDWDEINILSRVEKQIVVVETTKWVKVI